MDSGEIRDELLNGVVGGYDPNAYNPNAVAEKTKGLIAWAKAHGKSREEMLESHIDITTTMYQAYGGDSPEYQFEMDRYRYMAENWDDV